LTTLPIESQKTAQIRFTLNGEETDVLFAPYKTLLEVLREDLGHTGTKHGCELGECGACAVLLDGKAVLFCLVLALECGGKQVLTVEGLGEDGKLHPLQDAFADLGAAQCGYCTPAILVTAKALLDQNPHPSRDQIREAISGNLCRCTGYLQIFEAVEAAVLKIASKRIPEHKWHSVSTNTWPGGRMANENDSRTTPADDLNASHDELRVIGIPRRRVDGRAKVTGQTRFADDIFLPRMAHCKLLRSPHPHARIRKIDTTRATAYPGVYLVLTGKDVPIQYGILPVSQDEQALCLDRVRHVEIQSRRSSRARS